MSKPNEKVLSFEVPKKLRSTEKHNEMHMSDSGIAGTYVPNMSKKDMELWKAKHITGADERIEIRKTVEGAQILIVVYKNEYQPKYPKYPNDTNDTRKYAKYKLDMAEWHKRHQNVRISMNGKADLSWENWWDMTEAIKEAMEILL